MRIRMKMKISSKMVDGSQMKIKIKIKKSVTGSGSLVAGSLR
jgi:hypothetical protein